MPVVNQLVDEINNLVAYLVQTSLANDQNCVFEKQLSSSRFEVTFPNANRFSVALRNQSYSHIYDIMAEDRIHVVKLLDGALIQMQYLFESGELEQHRLAFFPSPHLEEFQNNPNVYLEDEMYADVVARNIVPFPVRFDFDRRNGRWKELEHPKSHLSLGQYQNCRIPVSSPIGPSTFIEFILRNFYNTAFHQCADGIPKAASYFDESILPSEKDVVHVQIPTT